MEDANDQKTTLVNKAKIAEQAERYEDMVDIMKEVAQLKLKLTADERNLLSVAYKNKVGTRRSSWRVISSIEQKEENENNKTLSKNYLEKISGEIEAICTEVVDLIDTCLLKEDCGDDEDAAKEALESSTFYKKMKGDYYRYVAEVTSCDRKADFAEKANEAYSSAYEICMKKLNAPHPIRLGLALNYSVFHYEIMEKHSEACKIARTAFDQALEDMDSLNHSSFKDSSLIMQLLRDNLTLWKAADEADGQEEMQEEETQDADA